MAKFAEHASITCSFSKKSNNLELKVLTMIISRIMIIHLASVVFKTAINKGMKMVRLLNRAYLMQHLRTSLN